MRKVEIKMAQDKRFFIATLSIIMAFAFNAEAASRVAVRSSPSTSRRSIASTTATVTAEQIAGTASESTESEPVIADKSSEFEVTVSSVLESATEDNYFAEQIRKQRAALAAGESTSAAQSAQEKALATNSNSCDSGLRKCMMEKCGKDFTKCALDGATIFGDKLNACRRTTECTGEEFRLFTTEIQADRDMNVRLASFNDVINCGNQYNACIMNECGTTYNKCLGKAHADAAIQKCATIAKECSESDSGLANRFGTAIGKLRENAEKEVKKDEERMYALRDMMASNCRKLGAMFDQRSFDCVFTVNFFAGRDQMTPMASRKRYAGDTFVCTQEWFGVNVTTYKENAYRETRAQTAASSAMLGSGVGTAVGLVTSGAIDRALDTQKAKKALKKEEKNQKNTCKAQGGTFKDGKCINVTDAIPGAENANDTNQQVPNEATNSTEGNVATNSEQKDMDTVVQESKDNMANTVAQADKTMEDAGLKKQADINSAATKDYKFDASMPKSVSAKQTVQAPGADVKITKPTTSSSSGSAK